MNNVTRQIFGQKYGFGKLFLKTDSVSVDWKLQQLINISPTQYTIIDNLTGLIVKQDVVTDAQYSMHADLSLGSGDYSIYLKVNDLVNGCDGFNAWYGVSSLRYIDFDVIPLNKRIYMYSGGTVQVVGAHLNLEHFQTYLDSYVGFDFSQTTALTYFRCYGGVEFDIEVDVSNNTLLEIYSSVVYSSLFSVSNHLLLEILLLTDLVNSTIDTNINTTFLSSLRELNIRGCLYQDFDFTARDFSKLTSLTVKSLNMVGFSYLTSLTTLNIYNQGATNLNVREVPNLVNIILEAPQLTTIDFSGSPIVNLHVNTLESISQLDLTPLTSLLTFKMDRRTNRAITGILINNGLNAQITNFERRYDNQTINVTVDDPEDANNGVTPYLATIWKDYLGNNSWNFIFKTKI
jgi:hypothetical protein